VGDNQLSAFIRMRREAIDPADVGLPVGPRRRTPGLRRAELATLAGISVEYLTRLEQGRDRHPSPDILDALAGALCLSEGERTFMHHAASAAGGHPLDERGVPAPPARDVRPAVRALLDRLEPAPALVLNRLSDVLAHTGGYERLAGPIGVLDAVPPNTVRFVFADPRARGAYPDWGRVADDQISALKARSCPDDPFLADFAAELGAAAGVPFTERMTPHPEGVAVSGVERVVHPEAGELRLTLETLELPPGDGQSLVVYLPADPATSAALDRLVGRRPTVPRTVGG
jgi:transcriptional regulator with XRE-family HTH domain